MQIRRHPGEGVVRDPLDIRRAGNFVFVGYALSLVRLRGKEVGV